VAEALESAEELLRKVPPHSLEAERAVLGALLVDSRAADLVAEMLQPEHFYRGSHAMIFEVILDLWREQQPIDGVLVREQLDKKGVLDQVGGTAALLELADTVPTSANATYYAEIVRDYATRRQLIQCAAEIQKDVFEDRGDTQELLNRSEMRLFETTQQRIKSDAVEVRIVVQEAFERLEKMRNNEGVMGVPSGFADLDELSQGFQPGEVTILAARPSMGKTTFGLNMLRNITVYQGRPACFFSLEMPRLQVTSNILCGLAKIDGHRMRGGYLTRDEERQFIDAAEVLGPAPLFIDDSSMLTSMDLMAKCRRLKSQHGIEMVMIDYLQLMHGSARSAKESRQQEVSEISRMIKALARELMIPVIALSQLSRKVTDRKDNRPMMSDLRESGSIEQDADMIMLLHRPEYYEPDNEELRNKAQLIVAKNRNGPTGDIKLHFERSQMRFESLTTM